MLVAMWLVVFVFIDMKMLLFRNNWRSWFRRYRSWSGYFGCEQ